MRSSGLWFIIFFSALAAACSDDHCLQPEDLRCLNIPCSNHGTCVIMNDKPVCVCDEGYHNENDTSCVPDLGTCIGVPDGAFCDDGLFCTLGETCRAGVCTGGMDNDCSDGDPCTIDSCDETNDVCIWEPASDGTGCDDGRWCTVEESCQQGTCGGGNLRDCSDDDPCTLDICDDKSRSCLHPPAADGTPCDDGLFCSTQDACLGGSCQPLNFRDCSDDNPCTIDSCEEAADSCTHTAAADGLPCDDGLFCTVGESCSAGACAGGVPRACSDGNACTADICDEENRRCLNPAVEDDTACEDGAWCTVSDRCLAGVCTAGALRDCSDGNVCTLDVCNEAARACEHPSVTDGTPCDDGEFCTVGDTCSGGTCGGQPRVCDDQNPCTADSCDEVNDGCTVTAVVDGTPCDDGQWCTLGEVCSAGVCASGAARNCSDGSACTEDSCDEAGRRCLNTPVTDGTPCDDGSWCTENEKCQNGVCGQGQPRSCDDTDPCTADLCDEASDSCVHDVAAADGTPCDDGLFCTVADACRAGSCAGMGRTCSDGNPCTSDSCDEDNDVCINDAQAANGLACDDGAFCTVDEACQGGSCVGGNARDCSDGNACTVDRCDENNDACINDAQAANGLACDDGKFCTVNDTCAGGACIGGPHRNCADDNQCTVDICNEAADSCEHDASAADGNTCNDEAFCTVGETCSAGICSGGAPRNCSDGNVCTVDSCDEASDRCEHDPHAADGLGCDDGAFCTEGETCSAGICTGGNPLDCADTDPCTFDRCNEVLDRCDHNPVPNGTLCDDGQWCTVGEACNTGVCAGGMPRNCSDGNQCTEDSCDENSDRCLNDAAAMNGRGCNDGLYCLVGESCSSGVCGGGAPMDCADGNQCTLDYCDEAADTCRHDGPAMNGASCDDGAWCSVGETCMAGSCAGGAQLDCDEGNSCTTDVCNEQFDRCDHHNVLNGTPCDDGLFCTVGDYCQAGSCLSGTGFACGDGNPCTADSCDEANDRCSFTCEPAGTRCFSPTQQVTCDGACNASGLIICPFGCNSTRQECNQCNPSTVECRADIEYLCNARFVCNAQGQIASKTCCTSNRCTCDGQMCLEDVCATATDVSAGGTFSGNTCDNQDNVPGDCFPGGPACRTVAQGGSPEEYFRFSLNDGQPTSRFYNVTLTTAGYDTSLRVSTICGSETNQVPYAEVCATPVGTVPLRACSEESGPEGMVLCGLPEGTFYGTIDSAPGTCGNYTFQVATSQVDLDIPARAGNISLGGVFTGNTCSLADNFTFPDTQLINGCSGLGNCASGSDPRACPRCDVSAATDCNIPMNASDSLCAYSGAASRDAVFYLALPVASGVDISTAGSDFDTVLYIMQTGPNGAQPPGAARLCNDDCWVGSGASHIQTALPAGLYYVYLDGAGGACGNYRLRVKISPAATCPNLGCEFPEENCRTCPFDCPCLACGDGVVDNFAGEECDDGNFVDNDGCTRCAVDPGWHCSGQPSVCTPVFSIDRTSNCNCSIPDGPWLGGCGTPRNDVINVGSACTIMAINIDMNITHTYKGDLIMILSSPDGTQVTLHNFSGGSDDNIIGNYEQTIYVDGPGALADFIGRSGQGNWTLNIQDCYNGDTGTLNSWGLHLTCY